MLLNNVGLNITIQDGIVPFQNQVGYIEPCFHTKDGVGNIGCVNMRMNTLEENDAPLCPKCNTIFD